MFADMVVKLGLCVRGKADGSLRITSETTSCGGQSESAKVTILIAFHCSVLSTSAWQVHLLQVGLAVDFDFVERSVDSRCL